MEHIKWTTHGQNLNQEIQHTKQMLMNNNFPNRIADENIKKFINKKKNIENKNEYKTKFKVFN